MCWKEGTVLRKKEIPFMCWKKGTVFKRRILRRDIKRFVGKTNRNNVNCFDRQVKTIRKLGKMSDEQCIENMLPKETLIQNIFL